MSVTRGYQVSEQRGCKVVTGQVPLMELAALLKTWSGTADESAEPNDWQVDAKLSKVLGVTMVAGPPEALNAWRIDKGIS